MSESSTTSDLWRFAPLDEYQPPPDAVGVGRIRKGLADFIRGITGGAKKQESPLDPEEDLLSLSQDRLTRAAPAPDWGDAARLLHDRLRPWLEAEHPAKPVVFYVAPPFAGRGEILDRWSKDNEITVINAPDTGEILTGHTTWFDHAWPENGPWVLPQLEKCFLRRAEGLDLVRELLARVLSGTMGRGVIGCDSWAWQFLQRVWLGRPSFTISALAFDAARLKRLFSDQIIRHCGPETAFRQADDGIYLIAGSDDQEADSQEKFVTETFWRRLAAHSRGNVGVARAYWKKALRTLPEKELEEESRRNTVWITPWNDLTQPVFPPDAGETALFVLHALLLHNGLDAQQLADILPGDRAAIVEALLYLKEAELVTDQMGAWRVTAYGYPVVRTTLQSNDFMSDPF